MTSSGERRRHAIPSRPGGSGLPIRVTNQVAGAHGKQRARHKPSRYETSFCMRGVRRDTIPGSSTCSQTVLDGLLPGIDCIYWVKVGSSSRKPYSILNTCYTEFPEIPRRPLQGTIGGDRSKPWLRRHQSSLSVSNKYPAPRTVWIHRGFSGSSSTFLRSLAIWLSTVRVVG